MFGYQRAVLMANTKYDYNYHGIEFSLVDVPDWGYYFEAEILTEEDKIEKAVEKIDAEIVALGLKVMDKEEFLDMLDDQNERPGARVDLNEVDIDELKKKYHDYF